MRTTCLRINHRMIICFLEWTKTCAYNSRPVLWYGLKESRLWLIWTWPTTTVCRKNSGYTYIYYIMAAFTITICQILILYLQSVGGHFDSCQLVQLDDTHIPARQPFMCWLLIIEANSPRTSSVTIVVHVCLHLCRSLLPTVQFTT